MIGTLLALVLVIVGGGYYLGWPGVGLAVVASFCGAVYGHAGLLAALRRDGYVAEHRPDMTGKTRWRVGVQDGYDPKTGKAVVCWIAPGDGPSGTVEIAADPVLSAFARAKANPDVGGG